MPPPIRWKWRLRGCDFGKSTVEVSLPTCLQSVTVGAHSQPELEKSYSAEQDNQVYSTPDTVDDRRIKPTVISTMHYHSPPLTASVATNKCTHRWTKLLAQGVSMPLATVTDSPLLCRSLSQLRHGDTSLAADPKLLKVRRQQGLNNNGSNDDCQYNSSHDRRNGSWCEHSRSCSNYNS